MHHPRTPSLRHPREAKAILHQCHPRKVKAILHQSHPRKTKAFLHQCHPCEARIHTIYIASTELFILHAADGKSIIKFIDYFVRNILAVCCKTGNACPEIIVPSFWGNIMYGAVYLSGCPKACFFSYSSTFSSRISFAFTCREDAESQDVTTVSVIAPINSRF